MRDRRGLVAVPRPARTAKPLPRATWEAASYVLLGLLVLAAVFLNDPGKISPDWTPQLYLAPERTFLAALRAWKPSPFLGQQNIHVGVAPVAALMSGLRWLGVPAWMAIRFWRVILILLAAWGAVRFFDRMAGGRSTPFGRVTAAAVYGANPYVIVSGSSMPSLLPYALFPLLLLGLAKSVERPASWRWPAVFALAFFGMCGINGGVIPLFLLLAIPAYLLYAWVAEGMRLRQAAQAVTKCLALAAFVSAYWVVPTFASQGAGESIAFTTEHPHDIAATSSYSETLRLQGMWLLYGYRPHLAGYLSIPPVVVATFIIPVAAAAGAWLSRSRTRLLAVLLAGLATPIMVGLFPPASPSPLGRAMRWAFDHVDGAIAFRTTNKLGPLLALGLTLLVALGAEEIGRRRLWTRAGAAVLGFVVLLLAVFPAWTGSLYGSAWEVPGYWEEAAQDLNRGSDQRRVLFLPGNYHAVYRWGMREIEDLNDSLLTRPSVLRTVLIYGPQEGANFLSALDVPLQSGSYRKATLPAMARYLGADEVLVRNDKAWEESSGVRPSVLQLAIREPGIELIRSYGRPGENVLSGLESELTAESQADGMLPPLQVYAVADAPPAVRAESTRGTVLLDGDNFAINTLAPLKILTGKEPFRLLGAMSSGDLATALGDGASVVITDTNRRRVWTFRRSGIDYGATLGPEDEPDGGRRSYALFWNAPETQTVAQLDGTERVDASSYGSVFGPVASSRPALAFDGDPDTAWLTGDYGTAVGRWIRLRFDSPRKLSSLSLRPLVGFPVEIASIRLRVGARTVLVSVPHRNRLDVRFPETTASSITLEIASTRGVGDNPVGLREVVIPGVRITETVRLPDTFSRLLAELGPAGRARAVNAPLHVVLTRQLGVPSISIDDEERALIREFALPQPRRFTVEGEVRRGSALPETVIDQMLGFSADVSVTSSSHAFDSPFTRAAQALDGDPRTAWVPEPGDPRPSIVMRFPRRRLDQLTVIQGTPGEPSADIATEAQLSFDGSPPIPVRLRDGTTRLRFQPRVAGEARLILTRFTGFGGEVRIAEVGIRGIRLPATDEDAELGRCVETMTMDGLPVQVRIQGTLGALARNDPLRFANCGEALTVGPGAHLLRSAPGWLLDIVHLFSPGRRAAAPTQGPLTALRSDSATHFTIDAAPASSPYYLVIGQAYDRRWVATMDGRPLGPPILIDGYSVGWRIDELGRHRFDVRYSPQRWVVAALVVSLLGIVLCLVLVRWSSERDRTAAQAYTRRWRWGTTRFAFPVGVLLILAWAWFAGGRAGLLVGLASIAIIGYWSNRAPANLRRGVFLVPVVLFALIPGVVLFHGLPATSGASPAFVESNLLANGLAAAALLWLVTAVVREGGDGRKGTDSE